MEVWSAMWVTFKIRPRWIKYRSTWLIFTEQEEEEGANGLGPLARSEDAAGAAALVVDDVAVDDSRRGHLREYRRLRQLMKKLYRVAKDKYDEDGDYGEFKKVEEAYSESVTKLDKKYPGLFWNQSWFLYQPESHQLSLHLVCLLETTRHIDWTWVR